MYIRRRTRGRRRASDMDKRYGHAHVVSLLALLFERHGELAVRVRAGRGLGADAPVEHGNLCAAKFRTWRDFLTLLTNEGRDDVVVLLDRAVGARREGREGRHHDLRLCVDGAQMIKLAPVATAYISAKHRSVPVGKMISRRQSR